jgi:hypothetical protein
MASKHSLAEWFPARADDLRLDAEKVERYVQEKEDAVALVRRWADRLRRARRETLPGGLSIADLARYVDGFRLVGEACLLSAWHDQDPSAAAAGCRPRLADAAAALGAYAEGLRRWYDANEHRHQLAMLMNPDRAEAIAAGAARRLA